MRLSPLEEVEEEACWKVSLWKSSVARDNRLGESATSTFRFARLVRYNQSVLVSVDECGLGGHSVRLFRSIMRKYLDNESVIHVMKR
jgi:hypothetical protein